MKLIVVRLSITTINRKVRQMSERGKEKKVDVALKNYLENESNCIALN